jgi:hypothetical protein
MINKKPLKLFVFMPILIAILAYSSNMDLSEKYGDLAFSLSKKHSIKTSKLHLLSHGFEEIFRLPTRLFAIIQAQAGKARIIKRQVKIQAGTSRIVEASLYASKSRNFALARFLDLFDL